REWQVVAASRAHERRPRAGAASARRTRTAKAATNPGMGMAFTTTGESQQGHAPWGAGFVALDGQARTMLRGRGATNSPQRESSCALGLRRPRFLRRRLARRVLDSAAGCECDENGRECSDLR